MKISRPMLYGTLAIVAVVAWVMSSPEDVAAPAKPKAANKSSSSAKTELFTKADREAAFVPVNAATPNAFKPIVARTTGPSAGLLEPNAIPADFAGGDPNWIYSGMATVDGVGFALVENTATSDGEFIKVNENWRRSRVLKLTPESLTLENERGVVRTVRIKTKEDELPPLPGGGLEPVNPLEGPIGNGLAVRPQQGASGTNNGVPTENSNEN